MWPVVAPAILSVLGILFYWLFIVTEGTYLGTSVVITLYDWTARRYERIKDLQYVNELYYVGMPIGRSIGSAGVVLDVATGTGRLPRALVASGYGQLTMIGLDRSKGMLVEARASCAHLENGVTWFCADSQDLPFADASCEAVTCLEALEFFVTPEKALREMIRVLKPGGVLWLSSRVGWESRLFFGRLAGRGHLERRLERLGVSCIETRRWQVHYDLVSATKPPCEPCARDTLDQ